jgi:isopentenyl phosphate kinase
MIATNGRRISGRVLMGTDVDGIFTAEPKLNPDARLIESIGQGNFDRVLESVGEATTVDVTQGMKGKLLKIREGLSGVRVLVYNITKEGNTFKALSGRKVRGTEIKL